MQDGVIEKLESDNEWDIVFQLKFDGLLKGTEDGMVINISPIEINTQVTGYDSLNNTSLGYNNVLDGLVIIIRHSNLSNATDSSV